MNNRIKIRVTMCGAVSQRELMLDGRKVSDFDYHDAAALARGLLEELEIAPREPVPVIIDGEEITLPFAEAIDTAMQALSSLRW